VTTKKHAAFRRRLLAPTLALVALTSGALIEGYSTGGRPWGTSTVPYYVNPRNINISESAAISAIQSAAAGWSEQSHANVQLVYAGQTSGASLGMNYKSEVFFRGGASPYVAEGYYWWDGTGKIVDGDIVFYEEAYRYYAFSGCTDGVYLENVAIHEFGHVLGLLHSQYPGTTMQPSMSAYCETNQLTLEPDDVAAIESLYPPLSGGNTAPSVTVGSPGNNSSFTEDQSISFSGSASDSQDGNITGTLQWTSNLLGPIGTGGSFSRTLSAGVHLITATAVDAGGLSNAKQVTVTVTTTVQQPPSGAVLTAHGYKVKGLQKVDLSWSGLSSPTVNVYRDNAVVATPSNNGSSTDAINKKGAGTYVYKVCEPGTSVCSNTVSVVF